MTRWIALHQHEVQEHSKVTVWAVRGQAWRYRQSIPARMHGFMCPVPEQCRCECVACVMVLCLNLLFFVRCEPLLVAWQIYVFVWNVLYGGNSYHCWV